MLVVQSFIKAIQALYAEFFNCIVQNFFAPFLSSSVNLANLWSDWFWLFYDDVVPGISQCWITAKLTAKVVKFVNNSLIDQAKFVDMSITTDSDGRLILFKETCALVSLLVKESLSPLFPSATATWMILV